MDVHDLLREHNLAGGYPGSLVATDSGLLIASHGEVGDEELAGFTSLFDDIVVRARRDLGLPEIDEVALRDTEVGRLVIRPVYVGSQRLFLVVRVPRGRTWRMHTNRLVRALKQALSPLIEELESLGELA